MTWYGRLLGDLYERRTAYESEPGTRHPALARRLVDGLAIEPGMAALDAGTGTGLVARLLAERVGAMGRVVGIDSTEGMLRQALSKSPVRGAAEIEYVRGDVTKAVYPAGSFDVITCCEALVLFEDIPEMLRTWSRWLKPGGRLAFTCTEEDSYFGPALKRALEITLQCAAPPTMHEMLGTMERIRKRLEAASFSVTGIDAEQTEQYVSSSDLSCTRRGLGLMFKGAEMIEALSDEAVEAVCAEFRHQMGKSGLSGVRKGTGLFFVYARKQRATSLERP